MSDELIIRQCAPTLAGIKTGSLFPCRYESLSQLMDDVRNLNRRLVSKGLSVLPMRCENGSALLYVYRPRRLQKDLSGELAQKRLQEAGYPCGGSAICVTRLVQRLRRQKEFPHEVGLFLSYPPEDVAGFIANNARRCKCSGLWKVYGDEARAKRMFHAFKTCTADYCRHLRSGKTLEELVVAV